MKENLDKYAQVYAHNAETNEGNEEKRRRRKRKVCAECTVQDNDKTTQVYLCCGKEVNIGEQYCQICSKKRVNVDFVDFNGYVDDHLQKQLLEFMQEKSNTWAEMCTPDISITDENDCYDLTHNIGIRSTDGEIVTDEKVSTENSTC